MPWKVEEWEEGEVMGEGGGAEEEEVAEEEGEQAIERKREGAPSPEPIPNNNMPSGSCQQTQSEGAGNWARYANPEATGMSTFGDVKKARIDQQLFVRAGDRSREQRAVEDFLPANAPKDSQHNTIAIEVLAKPEETSRAIYDMGKCKRLRRESAPPDRKKCQPAPSSDRSLEDLFRENPAKSLQTSLNANTLNTAREVVIQVVNEATQQWFDNWYPDTKLIEIFDSILVQRHEEKVLGKDYVVPPEAFDLGYMRTTIADTYRKCHDVHPNGAGDIMFPTLFNLIDHAIIFLRILKDNKRQASLQEMKSELQWIPVGLGAKRLLIMKLAASRLRELNIKFEKQALKSAVNPSILARDRKKEELKLLEEANADFKIHITTFNNTMLKQLVEVLAETRPPSTSIGDGN